MEDERKMKIDNINWAMWLNTEFPPADDTMQVAHVCVSRIDVASVAL